MLYVSSKFHGDILNISRDKELLSANLLGSLGLPMCVDMLSAIEVIADTPYEFSKK